MLMPLMVVCAVLLVCSAEARAQAPQPDAAPVPRIGGEWQRMVAPPKLEEWGTGKEQAVDFTVYQAADGTWQLISCIRGTAHPGQGRLLYRWESPTLIDGAWVPKGIFWRADPELSQVEGRIQAPHCVKVDGVYYLFYNSNGAYCLKSDDGKTFTHHRTPAGELKFFDMGRDVMLFDNRERDGKWYAAYTWVRTGMYPQRRGHTVGYRTAPALEGPWSGKVEEMPVLTRPREDDNYAFIDAESPFIVYRNGWYYRLEQMNVLASRDVTKWEEPILTCLTGQNPRHRYAPELIEHDGRTYIAGYQYNSQESGIYMAELVWPDAE